jgi:formate-dependent nitrite reductase cytochrome c552 subunit
MRNSRLAMMLTCILAVIALISACDRTVTTEVTESNPAACFDCHSDQNTELVSAEGQWAYSKHASGDNIDRNNRGCQVCHTSQGFVARVTGAAIPSVVENPTAIHCFTCHAPHTNTSLKLRVTAAQTLEDGVSFDIHGGNICAACHHARYDVNTYVEEPSELSTHWGPHHGPQADMLFGSNAYEFADNPPYGQTTHRSATEDGCLDCHFKSTIDYRVGGHSFNMMFVRENGDTLLNTACGGCHGTLTDFNRNGVQDSVQTLMEDLLARLVAAGLMDAEGEPLEGVTTSQDSAGAVWNFLLAEEDRSKGIHNAQYIIDFLNASIDFIEAGPGPGTPATAGKDEKSDIASRK